MEFNLCSALDESGEPCGKKIHARGLCHSHYMKQHREGLIISRNGETLPSVRIRFYATDSLDRALKRLSRVTGESVSAIMRDIIEAELKKKGVM